MCPSPTLRVRPCGPPSHGSGSGWFATPFLHDSLIHYFTPVYPDANQPCRLLSCHATAFVIGNLSAQRSAARSTGLALTSTPANSCGSALLSSKLTSAAALPVIRLPV